MKRKLRQHLLRAWPSDNTRKDELFLEFPSIEFYEILIDFDNLLLRINRSYSKKIRKFYNSDGYNGETFAIDIQENMYRISVNFLKETISKQEHNLKDKLNYYWKRVQKQYSASVSRILREIPFLKIAKGIYPVLREIVFFDEFKSKLNLSLARLGYVSADLKNLVYPVIVFPDMVSLLNALPDSRKKIHEILGDYDEGERKLVNAALLQLAHIADYTEFLAGKILEVSTDPTVPVPDDDSEGATLVDEDDDPISLDSLSTANTIQPKNNNEEEKEVVTEDAAAAAATKITNSDFKGVTADDKEGKALANKLLGDDDDELADQDIEDGLVEAQRNMKINVIEVKKPINIDGNAQKRERGVKVPKHVTIAVNHESEQNPISEIEDKRTALLESMKKYVVDSVLTEETIMGIQEEYDLYILEVNEMFAKYMENIYASFERNPLIKGKRS